MSELGTRAALEEIERDRRTERRVVVQAVVALLVVTGFVLIRLVIVG
ncbi:hypothetical protein [uncultured Microbacterium sp.]|nr:hypothetical protein [uncultured Microbacterium sp.]